MGSGVLAPDSMKRMKGYRLALTASLLNAIWEAVAANVAASVRYGIPLTIAPWEINNDRAYRVRNTAGITRSDSTCSSSWIPGLVRRVFTPQNTTHSSCHHTTGGHALLT